MPMWISYLGLQIISSCTRVIIANLTLSDHRHIFQELDQSPSSGMLPREALSFSEMFLREIKEN